MSVRICPLIYDVTLVARSTYTGYKSINSKNCRYHFTFFSSILSHLPVSEDIENIILDDSRDIQPF
jgi:hypothetical protein